VGAGGGVMKNNHWELKQERNQPCNLETKSRDCYIFCNYVEKWEKCFFAE